MRMVLHDQNSGFTDLRNSEVDADKEASPTRDYWVATNPTLGAARPDSPDKLGSSASLCKAGLRRRTSMESKLFEDAVVELLALPVGGGLDEGQDYRVRVLFGGRQLGLKQCGDEEAMGGRLDGANLAPGAAGDDGKASFHGGPFKLGVDLKVAEEFFADDFFVFSVEGLQVKAGPETNLRHHAGWLGSV